MTICFHWRSPVGHELPHPTVILSFMMVAEREAAKGVPRLDKNLLHLTRSSQKNERHPECQSKDHPFLPHISIWSVRPFWPHDLPPSLGSNAGKKPNARFGWSLSLLGLDGELWSTSCHSSAILLYVNKSLKLAQEIRLKKGKKPQATSPLLYRS